MDMVRTVRSLGISIVSVLLFSAVLITLYGKYQQHRVAALTADVLQLSEARNPEAAFKDLKQKYGSQMSQLGGCGRRDCAYQVKITNQLLAFLKIAPRVEFTVYFNTYYGKLSFVLVDFLTLRDSGAGPFVHTQVNFCDIDCENHINPWQDKITTESKNGMIDVGSNSPRFLKKKSLSLNASCLTRIGGCDDISDILPLIWERTGPGELKCKIQNNRGQVKPELF